MPRRKSAKPPARIHHRRFITQGMPRSSHGSRRLPKQGDDLGVASQNEHAFGMLCGPWHPS